MRVEYELDQWEWQGTTQFLDIDPDNYRGLSEGEVRDALHRDLREDAEGKMHLVYAESEIVQEILAALEADDDDDE